MQTACARRCTDADGSNGADSDDGDDDDDDKDADADGISADEEATADERADCLPSFKVVKAVNGDGSSVSRTKSSMGRSASSKPKSDADADEDASVGLVGLVGSEGSVGSVGSEEGGASERMGRSPSSDAASSKISSTTDESACRKTRIIVKHKQSRVSEMQCKT